MPLTLVVGRPNTGKTGVLYDAVRRSAAAGGAPVLLLPSRPDVQMVSREFAEHGPRLGVMTTVFDEYIDDLWAMHGDGRGIVGSAERALLLARAVQSCGLEVLAKSARGAGLARLLAPLAANMFCDINPPRADREVATEIAAVLAAYGRMLGAVDRIERATAVRGLESLVDRSCFPGLLVANRFTDLTLVQERFLVSAAQCVEVWLSLPWEAGCAATHALDALVARLLETGARLVEQPPGHYTYSDELQYLESHLFLPPDAAIGAPRRGDVLLSYAYGEDAEAERIVAEVQAALDQGVPGSQIAVVFQNAAEHAPSLRTSFGDAGIAADFDLVRRARQTGWGRALTHLMRFAIDGGRSDLLGFLRSPYSGASRDVVDEAEARWRRYRIDRPERLRASLRHQDPSAVELVDEISQLMGDTWRAGTGRNWQSLADKLLRNAYGGTARTLDPEGLLDAAAHRGFLRLVSEVDRLETFSATGYELMDAFLELEIAVSPESHGGAVRVLSAARARSQRFRVVIIGGLSAGDFPRAGTENPLAEPGIAAALSALGIEVDREDERDLARITFYLVASRATERLVLSRQVAASDGSEQRASWLLEELLDLYRDPRVEDVPTDRLPPITTLAFEDQAACEGAPRSIRRTLRTTALAGSAPSDTHSAMRLSLASQRAGRRQPQLLDERVLAELRERQVFSATEIETYLRCPYAWFHERVVRAEALEPEADAIECGRICHEALRRIFTRLSEATDETKVTPGNLTAVLALADQVTCEINDAEGEPTSLDQRGVRASVRRRVLGFLRAEAHFLPDFVPVAHEFEFDPDPSLFSGFQLRGRIDRIDRGPDGGLVVTDYKTGHVGPGHSATKFTESGLLQLALYARIVEADRGAPVVGALYRRVSSQNVAMSQNRGFFFRESAEGPGLVSTDLMNRDEIDEVVCEAERRALEAVTGMRAARIAADPLDPKVCQRCRIRRLCGSARP